MTRGEVFVAELNPVTGAEANKRRPVVLVGNNASLAAVDRYGRGVVTVVPLTSNTRTRGAMHVVIEASPLNGLATQSRAQAEQVRSIDHTRLVNLLGRLSAYDLSDLDRALRFHLDLD